MDSSSPDVMEALKPAGLLYSSGHLEEALSVVEALWDRLPTDKGAVPNAYLAVEYAVGLLVRLSRLPEARAWAERGFAFREKRHDLGEAEFLLAKVEYELGNLAEARRLLVAASEKSRGRVLRSEDPKYRALIRGVVEG